MRNRSHDSGFTLLETIVSMGITLIIVSISIQILLATYETSEEAVITSNRESLNRNFLYACSNAFDTLPNQSKVSFYDIKTGDKYNTYFVFENNPQAFNVNLHRSRRIDHVILAAEHRSDGWGVRVGAYYLASYDFEELVENNFENLQDHPYLPLLPKVYQFTWDFFDPNEQEWFIRIENFTPSLVKLTFQKPDDIAPMSKTFALQ